MERINVLKGNFDKKDIGSEYIVDNTGLHYVCPKCGKQYDDELDFLLCCLSNEREII